MTRTLAMSAILTALTLTMPTAQAEETLLTDCVDPCGKITFDADLMFLRPHQADGLSRNNVFDYETAPRFSISKETNLGAGVRLQYWGFDHEEADGHNGALTAIDTYNLDLDIFKRLNLGASSTVEVFGGMRYSEYEDINFADSNQTTSFDALGGFLGVQAWHDLAFSTRGFVRGKWAILMDDADDNGTVEYEVNRTHQEIALGIERCVTIGDNTAKLTTGGEWYNWDGYSDNADGSIGFGGFVFGLEFSR